MAATLTGRDISRYTSSSTLYTSSSTEYHNKIYSNGRIDSSYEYQFSGSTGSTATHTDYYGQWWIQNSGTSNGVYWADLAVHWYNSTDPQAIGTNQVFRISTSNGQDFNIGTSAYGSTTIADASGSGNDVVDSSNTATMGPTLLGKDGDDTLIGNDAHADSIFGGSGNDSLEGRGGDDYLYGQMGNDTLNGGAGIDIALYFSVTSQFTVTHGSAADRYTVSGPEGTDQLISIEYIQFAGAAPVTIESLVPPIISGTADNDSLTGSSRDDILDGLAGNDQLTGLAGNDTLRGGSGNDILDGGAGIDNMIGGLGNDIYIVDNTADITSETSSLSTEIDQVKSSVTRTLGGNIENLILTGVSAINGAGNILNNILYANIGNNVLNGGAGTDTVSYLYGAMTNTGVTVSLASTIAQNTVGSGSDTLVGIENLTGSNFNDTLTGNALVNVLNGGVGADKLSGGNGSDVYYVDSIGDRVSETNPLANTGGTDLVNSSLAAYSLTANVENGRILSTGAANLTGNGLNNVLYANTGNNVLDGGAGIDTVSYLYGAMPSIGVKISLAGTTAQTTIGSGSDMLLNIENLTGSNNGDTLIGNASNNTLNGGSGNDVLNGGAGNDIIIGGSGVDSLTGGTGNDLFKFIVYSDMGLGVTRDVIIGFVVGQDKIDLSAIDANTGLPRDQAFTFMTTPFSAAGQVSYSGGIISINTNADTAAEFQIQLTGVVPASLTASDFVL
jgi:Ca2+-binding RTX toxin-like protein